MIIRSVVVASTHRPMAVSPPARDTASWTLIYTHGGIKSDMSTIIRRVMLWALALKWPNTTGMSGTVSNPTKIIKNPNTTPAVISQRFSCRALSSSPLPSVEPRITPVAVVMPLNATKKRLAMAKLAAIPETTSAPPRPL